MGLLAPFEPLRRYADFRGRSTRSELLLFYLLLMVANVALAYAAALVPPEYRRWIDVALAALLACPALALMARRLHDTGRSAWWLLIGLPMAALSLWEAYVRFGEPLALSPIDTLPLLVRLALALSIVALVLLLLWDDEEQDNIHGPNPRYGPAEAAA